MCAGTNTDQLLVVYLITGASTLVLNLRSNAYIVPNNAIQENHLTQAEISLH